MQPPLHAAGEPGDPSAPPVGEPGGLERPVDALGQARSTEPGELPEEREVLLGGEPAVQGDLLRHDPDASPDVGAVRGGVEPEHPHGAGVGREQGREDAQGGRLARAIGPEQPEGLPALDDEIEPPAGPDVPEGLLEPGDLEGGPGVVCLVHGG